MTAAQTTQSSVKNSPKWTKEQQSVIDIRNKNMLVAAAAGSGKTAVLVERILTLVTDEKSNVDIDRILVVTFTKAAAGEMKDRLRRKLEEKLINDPLNERLQRQSTLIHNSRICTIDSFCSYVVKNYFYTIGVEPGFSIATKGELKTLQANVMDAVIEKHLEDKDSVFRDLLNAYCKGVNTKGFSDIIIELWDKAQSFPWPDEWLEKSKQLYQATNVKELSDCIWMKSTISEIKDVAREAKLQIEEAIEICGYDDGPDQCLSMLDSDYDMLDQICDAAGYDEIREIVRNYTYPGWTNSKKRLDGNACDPELKDRAKALRDGAKESMEKQVGKKGEKLSETSAIILEKLVTLRETAYAIIDIAKEYGKSLSEEKQKRNIYEFTDVAHLALDILRDKNDSKHEPTDVAKELADTYMQVMVDEYQDSNMLQEMILSAVCKTDKNCQDYFMVGDVKQSIYSFRRATPALFMEKHESFVPYAQADDDTDSVLIDLNRNFRSRGEVLDITNKLFDILMKKDMGGVEYDAAAALYLGNENYSEPNEKCIAELIVVDATENSGEALESEDSAADGSTSGGAADDADNSIVDETIASIEAKTVAKRISELMKEFTVFDDKEKTDRPLKYSDIVILMRSLKNVGKEFVNALRGLGIPAYLESENGFFEASEIMFLISYLKLIDNRCDDVSLAAVLHSPIYGISNDEMLSLLTAYKKNAKRKNRPAFFMAAYSVENPSEKLSRFFEDLTEFRSMASYEPVHVVLDKLISLTGCKNFYGLIQGGQRRLANIDKFIDIAVGFEGSGDMSVSGFARYLENMILQVEDPGLSDTISESDDVVRIMSIHKSKGLEFPVVFLSQTAHSFNDQDLSKDIIISDKVGMGVKYRNASKKQRSDTLVHKWIAASARKEARGEELRMLYVAMTRAKEKLIITGALKGGMEKFEKLADAVSTEDISLNKRRGARNYISWIAMALKAYEIKNGTKAPINIFSSKSVDAPLAETNTEEIFGNLIRGFDALQAREDEAFTLACESLKEDISYVYPYTVTAKYKSKYSVSEIKHRDMNQLYESGETEESGERIFEHTDDEAYIPTFIKGTETDENEAGAGASYGTAVHRFFELYDFARDDYRTSAEEQFKYMCDTHLLTDEQIRVIRVNRFRKFLDSDVAHRMHVADAAGLLFREQPFVFQTSPKHLGVDEDDDVSRVLVQGEIDAFWEEDGEIVLLDYKTDRVDSGDRLVLLYKTQLDLYKDALILAYNKPVKDVLIYSMRLGEIIDVR